jgi:glyoxylase-like metal-dependent hydrolase (beta-lactamase superfamily II)
VRELDVCHLGIPRVICCHEVDGFLIDPGPSSSLEGLLAALGDTEPRAVLLTHIHLDHAGATGLLVRRWPHLEVWVHERGARHVADPSRLVASAQRLYGDDMDRLWGEITPVPEANVRVLQGGERVAGWRVAYTPGHASHHVSYLHEATGAAFTGDVAGVRIGDGPVFPPTPPPDIDLDAWRASVDVLEAWQAGSLGVTHFGTFTDVAEHLAELREGLDRWGELARRTGAAGYVAAIEEALAAATDRIAYLNAMPPPTLWPGLDRYWRTRVS